MMIFPPAPQNGNWPKCNSLFNTILTNSKPTEQGGTLPNIISTKMNEFINKIENILTLLSELEGKYDFTLAKQCQGNSFPTQMELDTSNNS